MNTRRSIATVRDRAGFTLVELIMAVVLSTALLGAVFQLVFAQNRIYGHQQGLADARQSLRAGGTLLAWELRHVSARGGDVYAMAADSVSIRSFDGSAVVCRKRVNQGQYGLHSISGDIEVGDSALVYIVSSNRTADDTWRTVAILDANSAVSMSMTTTCLWPSAPGVELGVRVGIASNADTAGMRVGAPLRAFQRRTYRMIEQNGKWWLGVREGAGGYELLTGPLRAGNGLELTYLDDAGAVTAVPANVRAVEFTLRAESQLQRTVEGAPEDSVVMRVQLRG